MVEIWKDINNYEGLYQVSTLGRIKSLRRVIRYSDGRHKLISERILSPEICKSTGYLYVNLSKSGKSKHCTVHRLVAEAFIPNIENLPQINHLDEDRSNNVVENLEWCTCKHNSNYGKHNEKMSAIKRIQNKGKSNPFYGKHHSESVCKKISKRLTGTLRITDGEINKTIYPHELEQYLSLGWRRGMIKQRRNK